MRVKYRLFIILLGLPALPAFAQDPCRQAITRVDDPREGKVTYYTPMIRPVYFSKEVRKGVATWYLSLRAFGDGVNNGKRGALIRLDNGRTLRKPEAEIGLRDNELRDDFDYEYIYTAHIRLTPTDLELLKKHRITGFRLYVYEQKVSEREQAEGVRVLGCLTEGQ
ncbi:hypothetical protein [Larkinella soli]|uniref:hypothetical protein n=1 Tax=Larkinella soli TaxID=1770527 RepID=UPI000FFBE556|nr:hypothetical protein [Larkinella soli]